MALSCTSIAIESILFVHEHSTSFIQSHVPLLSSFAINEFWFPPEEYPMPFTLFVPYVVPAKNTFPMESEATANPCDVEVETSQVFTHCHSPF